MKRLKRIILKSALFLTLALLVGLPLSQGSSLALSTSGAVGIQGVIPSPPPSRGPTIAVPSNGATFTSIPITVSGLCPSGLLIKVFDNGVLAGAVVCTNGSYTLQIELFSGQNNLTADDYDALNQAGPASATVTVTFNNAQFSQYGTQLTLSSNYAELGAAPGSQLDWPITINGGSGPYALSIDWGDGSAPQLLSEAYPGIVTLEHTYQAAGVYKVLIRATDKNGQVAFLQLVGQATGAIQSNSSSTNKTNAPLVETRILWLPIIVLICLIPLAFWLGRKYQMAYLRKEAERHQL